MIGDFIAVPKDQAIKMIEEAPGDVVYLNTIIRKNNDNLHENQKGNKKDGKMLIIAAKEIEYQDNDFFGTLALYGTTIDNNTIKSILFPQLE